jgi:hypothetical protein
MKVVEEVAKDIATRVRTFLRDEFKPGDIESLNMATKLVNDYVEAALLVAFSSTIIHTEQFEEIV